VRHHIGGRSITGPTLMPRRLPSHLTRRRRRGRWDLEKMAG
jgi:hypothetical protein